MHPDFDTPENHLAREPFPSSPYRPIRDREQLRALEAALRQIDSTGRPSAVSLPARAESSPANGCGEPLRSAGGRGSATVPGLASMVGSGW